MNLRGVTQVFLGKPTNIYGAYRRLRVIRIFDPWRSSLCTCRPKYSLQPYTGCSHFCLYCYATAYIGQGPSRPKRDLLRNVRHDIGFINKELVIEMSSSSDPYPPLESWTLLTRKVLEILKEKNIRVLITTKSDLVTRDADLLAEMNSAVMITITTLDENLANILEPGAPPPSRRVDAISYLREKGVPVGVRIDPIIPRLNDNPRDIERLVKTIADAGAIHIVTSTYKARPDNFKRMINAFPSLKNYWERIYLREGIKIHGYHYLPLELRRRLLKPVIDTARKLGLTYATCREGLVSKEFFNAPSCDGIHLIKESRDHRVP
ncbi:MAG: radical SAM protein [Desulfurococcales archaeon]|nr:radical SAM protein [Desulfurococcales archaeon]